MTSNVLYRFTFFSILLISITLRLIIVQVPFYEPDSGGYIHPAISFLAGGEFLHVAGRSFIYPLFLNSILSVFNSFSYIPILQHLFGVLAGLLLLLCWEKTTKFYEDIRFNKILNDFGGLFLFALFLFNSWRIYYEHTILRESIFSVFCIFFVYCFIRYVHDEGLKKTRTYWFGFIAFVLNYFLFVFQPRWGFGFFFNLFLYLVFFFRIKNDLKKKFVVLLVAPIFFCLFFIFLPESYLGKKDPDKITFLPATLFFWHQNIIHLEMEKDIKNKDFKRYDKNLLIKLNAFYLEKKKNGPDGYEKIGYNPDKLLGGNANVFLNDHFKSNIYKYRDFCLYYFFKSIFKHPLKYIAKVFRELSTFYSLGGHKIRDGQQLNLLDSWKFSKLNVSPAYQKNNYPPVNDYIENLDSLVNSKFRFIGINGFHIFYYSLNKSYIIILLTFILLFIVNAILYKHNKFSSDMVTTGLFCLYSFSLVFFINLTSASIHALATERYVDDHFIIILLSEILAIRYIITSVQKYFQFKSNVGSTVCTSR